MESIKTKIRYIIPTTVQFVEEKFRNVHVEGSGHGAAAAFTSESLGWFVEFTDSHEALYLGKEKPFLENGDAVNIIIEKK